MMRKGGSKKRSLPEVTVDDDVSRIKRPRQAALED